MVKLLLFAWLVICSQQIPGWQITPGATTPPPPTTPGQTPPPTPGSTSTMAQTTTEESTNTATTEASYTKQDTSMPTSKPPTTSVTSTPATMSTVETTLVSTTASTFLKRFKRTIVFLYTRTESHQYVFLRGAGFTNRQGKIAIIHHLKPKPGNVLSEYHKWSNNDTYLDWNGAEEGQAQYKSSKEGNVKPEGTPLIWTTDDRNDKHKVEEDGYGYTALNHYGPSHWMLDVLMNCNDTNNGWFQFKGYLREWRQHENKVYNFWEYNIKQSHCTGRVMGLPPTDSINHFAKCGYVNVFKFNENECQIFSMNPDPILIG